MDNHLGGFVRTIAELILIHHQEFHHVHQLVLQDTGLKPQVLCVYLAQQGLIMVPQAKPHYLVAVLVVPGFFLYLHLQVVLVLVQQDLMRLPLPNALYALLELLILVQQLLLQLVLPVLQVIFELQGHLPALYVQWDHMQALQDQHNALVVLQGLRILILVVPPVLHV